MRFLGIILILLALFGCDLDVHSQKEFNDQKEQKENLEKQVQQLLQSNLEAQEKIEKNYAKRMADFDQAEYLAGIAQGCRAVINVCPKSMTAPGDAAIAAGASGGGTNRFWTIWAIKCAVFLGGFLIILAAFTYRLRPDLQAKNLADEALAKTRVDQIQANELLAKTNLAHAQRKQDLTDAEESLDEYEDQIETAKDELQKLEHDIKKKKDALDALGSFKL